MLTERISKRSVFRSAQITYLSMLKEYVLMDLIKKSDYFLIVSNLDMFLYGEWMHPLFSTRLS